MGFEGNDRFRVTRQLGAGGMGVVYEAMDVERDERVALKTLHEMDADTLFRFKREFRTLHGIEHPNLVRLGELVEHAGAWFFTMELVPGKDFLAHVWVKDWREESRAAVLAPTVRSQKGEELAAAMPEADAEAPATKELAFDEAKLRDGLSQLAAGIAAIHAAGKVHRDIKPSNVSVAPDGRVVVLDFGLITGTEHGDRSTVAGLCGTPEYMAPEQISDGRVGPPADWYAFGVILYEALTARLPVTGTPVSIMADKLRKEPPAPRVFSPDAPPDLEALCLELLRIDPAARPQGSEIAARLALGTDSQIPPPVSDDRPSTSPFIGRKAELTALDGLWDTFCRERYATSVFVDAVSGMGKSALLAALKARLQKADSSIVILEGRGYQHESIPYNAFDHVIDALSRFLRSLPAAKAGELMPRNAWLLPRLFPILGRVGPISRLTRAMSLELDAHELRTRCFAAFRELLARIAERQPLVIVLDDLQWAGRDSLMLLGEIIRPPDPPPMFLVLASREPYLPDPHARPDAASRRWWALPEDLTRISLGPLPPDDACSLAAFLIDRARLDHLEPSALATEGEGHPLLMQELVRYASLGGGSPGDHPRLDDAVRARTRTLSPTARRVLTLAVVAGNPVSREVLGLAAELDARALGDELGALERAYLLRRARMHVSDAVEPFHDRVREAMLASLSAEDVRDQHALLATGYAGAVRPDDVQLTRHLIAAGEGARAAETALRAAEEAEKGLAFDRAAEHYRVAHELRRGDVSRHGIRVKYADALARAGRGIEAGEAYEAASREAEGARAMELQGFAAQQFVRAGDFDRGVLLVRRLLHSIGVDLPGGGVPTLVRVLGLRFLLWLRGTRIKVRPAGEVSAETARRVDLLHDFATTMTGVDAITGAWLTTRTLFAALRAGERGRLARALAVEAAWLASNGGGRTARVDRLIGAARALEAEGGLKSGWSESMEGTIALVSSRFSDAVVKLDAAEAIFSDQPDTQLEVAALQIFKGFALYPMGRYAELRALAATRLRVAFDAGDRYHMAFHRLGPSNVATWLVPDEPARAIEDVEVAMTTWSRAQFDLHALMALVARTETALYASAELAWQEILRAWPALSRSMMLNIPWLRGWAVDLRGRAAIARAARVATERADLLREAERAARTVDRPRVQTGPARATLLRAGIASVRGDRASEERELDAAARAFEALSMSGHAAAARRRLGALRGGAEGAKLVAAADAWFENEQIQRPARWTRMLAPSADAEA